MGAVPLDAGATEDEDFAELLDFPLDEDNLSALEEATVFPSELSRAESLDSTVYSSAPKAFSNSS
jgi:hypothetical protein